MNDPGLDEPIQNAASEANQTLSKRHDQSASASSPHDDAREEELSYTMPARWWYASTAFPLIAGTFGPMANAFSICALVENWRVEIPPGGTEEKGIDIRDPRWLIAVNAVSLAFALIANLSLLLNMAKRLKFAVAQPITILGFWMASALLIGLISTASTASFHKSGVRDQALTQAYYYAVFAAGIYQIISYLMCITVWGAYRGVYSKSFDLTVAQRTLMLQTIAFLVYMLLGALVFSHIEGWKYLDAVFWADFTSLTVGLGQPFVPATHLGRGLLFPFAIGSIIVLGLVVGSIRSLILERGAQKLSARMTEKIRNRVVKQVDTAMGVRRSRTKPIFGITSDTAQKLAQQPQDNHLDELRRRKLEFETMRKVQRMAARERSYMALSMSMFAFAILWFIGAVVFWRSEYNQQWTYFQSLYFCYTTVLTIGYGDFQPYSNSGKAFFVFWTLLAVPTLTILISNMGDTVVKFVKDATIWLGEISVLPSTESRMFDRLKAGVYKATLGQWRAKDTNDEEEDTKGDEARDDADEWNDIKILHPGLIKVFQPSDARLISAGDIRALNKLSAAWQALEAVDEADARKHDNRRAEAEHHYRKLLISHVPKVYADTKLTTPKKYNYLEWTFYLKLLGEDESDGSLHKLAEAKKRSNTNKKQQHSHHPTSNETRQSSSTQGQRDRPQWSWIGRRSPLMGDKDEAEWLLEKLFDRLEQSIHAQSENLDLDQQEQFNAAVEMNDVRKLTDGETT